MSNLKRGIIQKFSPEDKKNYQDDIKNNYTIIIKKSELDDLIFALNIIINDIKVNQNRQYIINEIENIITKLKNADIPPPKKDIERAPTFSTVDLENDVNYDKKSSYSPLKPGISGSQIDNTIYSTNILPGSSYNKEKYEGPIINGKKEGKGIYIYQNGCKYEGYFRNDKKEGEGIFYYANGDRYKGNFLGGYYQGFGIFYFNNGDRYEGEFKNDKPEGKGIYYYNNGDRSMGDYLNDNPIGIHAILRYNGKVESYNY